jgi:hypothetical protein
MSSTGVTVDTSKINRLLSALSGKETKQAAVGALRKSAVILQKETNEQLAKVVNTNPREQRTNGKRRMSQYSVRVYKGASRLTGQKQYINLNNINSDDLYSYRGKGFKKAVRIKIVDAKSSPYAKVHIMGDFRLKFFELGTKERKTKGRITSLMISNYGRDANKRKKSSVRKGIKARLFRDGYTGRGHDTGRIKPTHFFRTAQQLTERRIFDNMEKEMTKQILRIAKRNGRA